MPAPTFRVCLISTVQHNVGDDFVREGGVWLLRKLMPDCRLVVVHKHFPVSARGGMWRELDFRTRGVPQAARVRYWLSRLGDCLPLDPATDAVLGSDLVVQCGAPVYWKNRYSSCAETEWWGPLIEKRWETMPHRVPLINIGAGSCQGWGASAREVAGDPRCEAFIRRFMELASLTTTRDVLAQEIIRACGYEVPLLPCLSIFAPLAAGTKIEDQGWVALNYMPSAGHFDLNELGEKVGRAWKLRFIGMARKLISQYRCRIICHDVAEYREVRQLLPDADCHLTQGWEDALAFYAGCRFAVVNRVHGAIVSAAMGKPVLLIGNDSRVLTADLVPGITSLPVTVDEATFEKAVSQVQTQAANPAVSSFVDKSAEEYLKLLKPILCS